MTRRWRIAASTGERVGRRVEYWRSLSSKRRKYTRTREREEDFQIIRHNLRRRKRLRQTKTGMSPLIVPKNVSLSINPYHFSGQGLTANFGSLEKWQMSRDVQ